VTRRADSGSADYRPGQGRRALAKKEKEKRSYAFARHEDGPIARTQAGFISVARSIPAWIAGLQSISSTPSLKNTTGTGVANR